MVILKGRDVAFLRSTIPEHVAPTDGIVFYCLDDPLVKREIYLTYPKRKANPMRQHLIDFIRECRPQERA